MVTRNRRIGMSPEHTTDHSCQRISVRKHFERAARVRKVIPVHEGFSNDSTISLGRETTVRIVRLFTTFELTEQETHDSDIVQMMARDAARSLAQAEDEILINGTRFFEDNSISIGSHTVFIDPIEDNLLGLLGSATEPPINVRGVSSPPKWGFAAVDGVQRAIVQLANNSLFSPLGLLLQSDVMRDVSSLVNPNDHRTPLEQIEKTLDDDGKIEMVPRIRRDSENVGFGRPCVLLPLDDGSIEIIEAEPANLVDTGRTASNLRSFCVQERIALRIRDKKAIQIISFFDDPATLAGRAAQDAGMAAQKAGTATKHVGEAQQTAGKNTEGQATIDAGEIAIKEGETAKKAGDDAVRAVEAGTAKGNKAAQNAASAANNAASAANNAATAADAAKSYAPDAAELAEECARLAVRLAIVSIEWAKQATK